MSLNKRLKIARKQSGKTQTGLAISLGISEGTIKRYEKDASKIPVEIVLKIALLCDTDEIWLLTGQGKMLKDNSITGVVIEQQDIIKRFKDPERGLKINQKLIEILETNENVFDNIEAFINGAHQAVKGMNKASKKLLKKG